MYLEEAKVSWTNIWRKGISFLSLMIFYPREDTQKIVLSSSFKVCQDWAIKIEWGYLDDIEASLVET